MLTAKLSRLRQTIQTGGLVSTSRGLPVDMHQVAPTSSRWVCYEVQQQTSSVYVTSSRSPGLGSPCNQPVMGGSGCICYASPPASILGSDGKAAGLPMQENHSDCSMVAKHALVLGSSGHVKPNFSVPAQPDNMAFRSDFSQESANLNLNAWLFEPQLSEQSFSEAVAARIEASPRFNQIRL